VTAERCNMAFPYMNGASSTVSLTQRGSTWVLPGRPTNLNFGQ
jgi:hypothetical protein